MHVLIHFTSILFLFNNQCSASSSTSNIVESGLQQLRGRIDQGLHAIGARGESNLNKGLQVASGILQYIASSQVQPGAVDVGANVARNAGEQSAGSTTGTGILGQVGQSILGSFMQGLTGSSSQQNTGAPQQTQTPSHSTADTSAEAPAAETDDVHDSASGANTTQNAGNISRLIADLGVRALHNALQSVNENRRRSTANTDDSGAAGESTESGERHPREGDGTYVGRSKNHKNQ